MPDMPTIRTYKYRLYPTPAQEKNLMLVLECARNLYNMILAEWKYTYQTTGKSPALSQLEDITKRYRKTFPKAQQMFSQTGQSVVNQVKLAFDAFFRRVKSKQKAGYPRYKSSIRFNSFEFKQYGSGVRIDGKRLKLFGIGRVRINLHRTIPEGGIIKTVRIIRQAGNWYACFAIEMPQHDKSEDTGNMIGIDVGISALLTTSNGDKVVNPNYYRNAQKRLRILQRKLARAKRGSNNRRKALLAVQKQQAKVANQRRDYLHKLSHNLIKDYDFIALEGLQVKNMARNRKLSKSILDSGWSIFKELLTYKAESAGRKVVFVEPSYTSKTCSNCGQVFMDLTLSQRWVQCDCGLSLDRDHNAAINILNKGLMGLQSYNSDGSHP